MRDIRPLSSLLWHDPHLARTRSFCTGMPSFCAGDCADPSAGGCARADDTAKKTPRRVNQPTRFSMRRVYTRGLAERLLEVILGRLVVASRESPSKACCR